MTDTSDTPTLEDRWYQDPEGKVMHVQASVGTPVELPDEWALLPPELGARLFAEQQQHAVAAMAEAVADAADETRQKEEERVALLNQFAALLGISVEQAALLLGVPQPGERPMSEPHLTMLQGSDFPTAPPVDNVGL